MDDPQLLDKLLPQLCSEGSASSNGSSNVRPAARIPGCQHRGVRSCSSSDVDVTPYSCAGCGLLASNASCIAVLVAYYLLLCHLYGAVCLLPSMETLVPSMALRQPLVGLLHARVPQQQQQQQQQHAAASLPLAVWLRAVTWAPLVHRAQASQSAALHRASSSGTRSLSWSRCGGSLRAGPGRPWTVRCCPLTRSWLEAKIWGEASGLPLPVQTRWPRWSTLQAPQASPRSALWTEGTRLLMAWSMRALS